MDDKVQRSQHLTINNISRSRWSKSTERRCVEVVIGLNIVAAARLSCRVLNGCSDVGVVGVVQSEDATYI